MTMSLNNKEKWFCYIIRSINPLFDNHTYNGSTNDLKRRLRQHNSEIVGGASSTEGKGPWEYLAIMTGYSNHNECLSCEWYFKHPTNKRGSRPKKYCGVNGRVDSLNVICEKNNWEKLKHKWLTNYKSNTLYYELYVHDDYFNIINNTNYDHTIIVKKISDFQFN